MRVSDLCGIPERGARALLCERDQSDRGAEPGDRVDPGVPGRAVRVRRAAEALWAVRDEMLEGDSMTEASDPAPGQRYALPSRAKRGGQRQVEIVRVSARRIYFRRVDSRDLARVSPLTSSWSRATWDKSLQYVARRVR